MASSSGSKRQREYEVFLSFRGEDTRNSFVSHLYTALDQKGIITYMDERNLENGQSISPELLKSIENSRFAIIVFSKNYASSTWCLDELVKIMDCRTKYGQTVIPIFYDVDPSDVRKQNNSFAESFAKHEVNFKDNMKKVQIWNDALTRAASLAGEDIRGRNEASCIKKIVAEIFSKLLPKAFTKNLVGIESHMKVLHSLLLWKPNEICFVGIWGMGGIGKTTIARAIFDKLIGEFDGGCFLQDVSKRKMVDLQNILLSKVLKLEHVCISDEIEGSSMIRDRLFNKKVLLVLDDLDDLKQLKSLAAERKWFGKGSRIIITTRDKHLLNEVNETYEVKGLSDQTAMQLFSWHAFKKSYSDWKAELLLTGWCASEKSYPDGNFVHLSRRVVKYACGLPLALEVLGSYLHGRGADDWESALDRLRDAPEDKIFAVLNISFEGLNDIQQDIFLDIACFFRGKREDEVKKRLHSFGFHPVDGITILIKRSLVHILDGKIQMHDLIQEMGWHIVRRKANKEPGRFSRLWLPDDIIDVLTNNMATAEIEGMVLKEYYRDIKLSKGAFRNMNRLRLLEIHSDHSFRVHFSRDLDYLPNRLRWLYWAFYPTKSLPENFEPIKLLTLELPYSQIVQTPDFSSMPNLEVLNLSGCRLLLEVHPSIGVHKKLVHLNLSWCTKLETFPRIIQMESLEILNVSGCTRFQCFLEIHGNMSRLRIFNLEGTKVRELPSSIGSLELNQETISLGECNNLANSQPSSLKRKRVEYDGALENIKLLPAFPHLPLLQTFFVRCFSSLQVLHLNGCYMLEALPELPSSIKQLVLDNCTGLKRIPHLVVLLERHEDLHYLSLRHCWQLIPQTNPLRQTVPQFLSTFWEGGSMAKVLSTRQEVLLVSFPRAEIPNWLNCQKTGPEVTVTLSPSCYYDKLRGFALCAISSSPNLDLFTCDGVVKSMTISEHRDSEHFIFLYIPIGTVTSCGKWQKHSFWQKLWNGFLFKVTNLLTLDPVNTWGFRLVYEGAVDVDNKKNVKCSDQQYGHLKTSHEDSSYLTLADHVMVYVDPEADMVCVDPEAPSFNVCVAL